MVVNKQNCSKEDEMKSLDFPGYDHFLYSSFITTMYAPPSRILLTPDSLLVLCELSDRAGWARVKHRHKLETVLKITAKKKNPDIITFKFGTGAGETAVVTEQLRFRIPNTHKATDAIKNQILKYQGQLQQQQGRR